MVLDYIIKIYIDPTTKVFGSSLNTINMATPILLDRQMYQIPGWTILIVVLVILVLLFAGMFVLSYFGKKRKQEDIARKNKGNALIERNTLQTRENFIVFIEEIFNKYSDYDEKNIKSNVAKIKKDVKAELVELTKTDDYIEYELVYGTDDLIQLMNKLMKEPYTVWKNFFDEELRKVKENVK